MAASGGADPEVLDAPRGRRERRAALVPLILATMASQALLVVLAPTMVDAGRSFEASVGAVGQARSIAAAAAIAFAALVPAILARGGLRALLATGIALAVTGMSAAAAAPALGFYLAAHVLVGAGVSALLSAGFAGVAALPAADRAAAMGYVASANALAWIVANPIIGVLTDAISWRAAQLVPAAIALAALAALPRIVPLAEPAAGAGVWRLITGDRPARRWAGAEMLAYCAWAGALLTFVGAYFIEEHGVSESATGVMLALGAGAYVIAAARSGALLARFPREPLMRVAALAMSVLLVGLFAFGSSVWPSFALFCLVALLAGVRTPASAGLGLAQLPDQPGLMMALRTAMTQLGYLLGAVASGLVLAASDFEVLGPILAVVMVASAWVMSGVPDPDAR